VLDPLDDFPIHQSPTSLAENPLGINAYDRYFFNGYSDDGSLFFAAALGVYPNRGVIDAAFSVVRDGHQSSVFASGRLGTDRRRTAIGPITIDIADPMRTIRVTVEHEALHAGLTFSAITPAVLEPRFTQQVPGMGPFDYTRYTQFGAWTGGITLHGEDIDVAGSVGCRDRSWGQRPVGGPSGAAPAYPQFFWLWAPINFEDGALHFDVNDHADGSRWHDAGFRVPLLEPGDKPWSDLVEPMQSVGYELSMAPGTRWAESATLTLQPWNGEAVAIELELLLRFQMKGLGYGHPEHGHGSWQGDDLVAFEIVDLGAVDPAARQNVHIQHLVRAMTSDGRSGLGVLEILAIGPHEPTGLTGIFDVAT
jgi:hypothetical protein